MTRNKIKILKINNIKHINSIDSCYPEDMKQIIKYCIIVRYTTATENFEEISTVILTWGKNHCKLSETLLQVAVIMIVIQMSK